MNQNTIALLIVGATALYTLYTIYRLVTTKSKGACGGCPSCELKHELKKKGKLYLHGKQNEHILGITVDNLKYNRPNQFRHKD